MDKRPGKSVGVWIRVSTEDQAQGESPEHHEYRARAYAEAKGWHVVRVYDLSAVSGKSVMDHHECQAMLEDLRAGRVSGLIFSKLARLARNTKELLEFAELFQKHGADLISLQESIDTSTPAGRFFYTMIAAMAQWEREEIVDRVKASVQVRAKLGKRLGGIPPFGYQWTDGKLTPDPHTAPVRRLVYELFLEHRRFKTVATILNKAGHRTGRGSKFSDTTVRRLLEDPIAKGQRRANYSQITAEGKVELKPEEEWIWSQVEPIVSAELWDECNRLIAERRRGRKPYRRTVHLFSGVTHCHCGGKMYKLSNTPKYVCRACRNKIPVGDLETVFVEQLKGFFLDADEVAGALAQSDQVLKEREALKESMERERRSVRAEMDKLYRLYLEDQLSVTGFGERNRPLEERLAQLDEEIPRLQGAIDYLAVQNISAAEIVSEAESLYSRWGDLSFEDKRGIVETIVERIVIGTNEIDIRLAIHPPTPPPDAPSSESTGDSRVPPAILKDAATKQRNTAPTATPSPTSWCPTSRRPSAASARAGRVSSTAARPAAGKPWRRRSSTPTTTTAASPPARTRSTSALT